MQFYAVPAGATGFDVVPEPIPFTIIGGDDGLASSASTIDTLLFEPSARFDVIFDFKDFQGFRIIMANLGGDSPFQGPPSPQLFNFTDRVMSFDVELDLNTDVPDDFDDSVIGFSNYVGETNRVRQLALFEGKDEYGRLQPLLGTAEPGRLRLCESNQSKYFQCEFKHLKPSNLQPFLLFNL